VVEFQKAFDKASHHKRLMMKMYALGITALVFNWMEDYWLQSR